MKSLTTAIIVTITLCAALLITCAKDASLVGQVACNLTKDPAAK